jgi:1-aminocyclopropane-1-carboxylate deaminase/D-cysteine desulfhydrase-like pyridoxal-dependent ACC family enzyme
VQSNHTRAVTGVAAHRGLQVVTVQERWVDWPDVVYDKVGNLQLTRSRAVTSGWIGMVRSGEIPAGSTVLYAHLGGQPALSAYAGIL